MDNKDGVGRKGVDLGGVGFSGGGNKWSDLFGSRWKSEEEVVREICQSWQVGILRFFLNTNKKNQCNQHNYKLFFKKKSSQRFAEVSKDNKTKVNL